MIRVILDGGPRTLSNFWWIESESNLGERIKVPTGVGYEHFTHEGKYAEYEGEEMPIFRWIEQRKVAE